MRKLVSIRKIDSISPIEGADKIELAHTGGWQCVVRKGDFSPDSLAVFFEIDSALPVEDERFSFLKERCLRKWMNHGKLVCEVIRIKTCKFCGQISQGLFMPLSAFPELKESKLLVGTDLTELLKVKHYDELAEEMGRITGKARLAGNAKGIFPSFIPKTDEERLQNLSEYFEKMKDVEFECTEKFDGSSMTVYFSIENRGENPFGVCSRNLDLKLDNEDNSFVEMARKLGLQQKLQELEMEIAIQGELVGPGINGNRDFYEFPEFRVFRIFDIASRNWLTPEERYQLCEELNLSHVKVVRRNWKVFNELTTMNDFLEFVKGKTDRGHEREGMVWKSMDGTISFKVINNEYLLKQKD